MPAQRQGCDQDRQCWHAVGHGGPHAGVRDPSARCGPGRPGACAGCQDIEIAVLRHQLMVVRRQVARPRYTPTDRMVLATLAKLLPRERWPAFLVTPATLLRWHRELVARRWTYRHTGRGQQGLDPQVVDLVVRMARENPRRGYLRIVGECRKLDIRCQRRRCAGSCVATASGRHPGVVGRAGQPSCARRPAGCWRVTFVCHERDGGLRCRRRLLLSGAASEMGVGPPRSPCRGRP
jgi:hypothetical protein